MLVCKYMYRSEMAWQLLGYLFHFYQERIEQAEQKMLGIEAPVKKGQKKPTKAEGRKPGKKKEVSSSSEKDDVEKQRAALREARRQEKQVLRTFCHFLLIKITCNTNIITVF